MILEETPSSTIQRAPSIPNLCGYDRRVIMRESDMSSIFFSEGPPMMTYKWPVTGRAMSHYSVGPVLGFGRLRQTDGIIEFPFLAITLVGTIIVLFPSIIGVGLGLGNITGPSCGMSLRGRIPIPPFFH
uniref:Uncharacterized protein n=1 Tax=Cannabis sativa TaxID=3483 RepID=A0A803Q809_CANSA